MFSEHCKTFLRARSRVLSAWDREALEQWLARRGAPLLDAHVRWEEALARVLPTSMSERDPGGGLLEVEGVRFGSVGLAKPWRSWTVERVDGEVHVLVGMSVVGYARRFYLREDGALFLRQGRLWILVAENPFAYLERMAARDVAARTALTVTFGRRAGDEIASALGIAMTGSASDARQRCWADARACVLEGAWDHPAQQVTTVYLGAWSVARPLLAAAERLGIPARVESSAPSRVTDSPTLKRDDLPADALRVACASPSDLCDGLVAYEARTTGGRIVQIEWERDDVFEQASFTETAVEIIRSMPASRHLAGRLTSRALAWLDGCQFLRDPRRTCRSTTLADLLARHRLVASDHVIAFEGAFGGILQDARVGGFRFGVFDMLTVQQATGQYGGRYETEHEPVLLCGEDWPRVRWQDEWLVPIGDLVSTHLYMAEDGVIYEHAWEVDELYPSAERGEALLERLAAAAHHRRVGRFEATIGADVGAAIAAAESTPRIEEACDRVGSYWQNELLSLRAEHGLPPGIARTIIGASSEEGFLRAMRNALSLAPEAEVRAEGESYEMLERAGIQVFWS